MPDDLAEQVPKLKEVLDALRIATAEFERYEADDVLATLAVPAAARAIPTLVDKPDKDQRQIRSE